MRSILSVLGVLLVCSMASAQAPTDHSLTDSGLRQFMTARFGTTPPAAWTVHDLAESAFYYNPDLAVARARVGLAQARLVTARARPNPTLRAGLHYALVLVEGTSPWTALLNATLPGVSGPARRARIQEATAQIDRSRLQEAGTAWQVYSRVRGAAASLWSAEQRMRIAEGVLADRQAIGHVLQQRLEVGEIGRPQVLSAQADITAAQRGLAEWRLQVQQNRLALAAATGVPESALDAVTLDLHAFDAPPELTAARPELEKLGLLGRFDVRAAVDAVAAADAQVRAQVAGRHPPASWTPRVSSETGQPTIGLDFSVPLTVRNRNEGPIAEAVASRQEAAALLDGLQHQVLNEVDTALASWLSARQALALAVTQRLQAQELFRTTRQSFAAGTADRLALTQGDLQTWLAEDGRLRALAATQQALGKLEDAVQRPLDDPTWRELP
ncbi:MAG: TolC family protein [Candidatus Xenobia bacterium]